MTKGNVKEDSVGKPSKREVFDICGPHHLKYVDWRVPDQRRSVAASLVQGVYILERDRQQKREENALAPIWWEFFHFKCIQILIDQVDSSIFGAVYEYKPQLPNHHYPIPSQHLPPKYVIAFRGTVTKPDTRKRDLQLDLHLALNGLTRTTRFQTASQVVQTIVAAVGPPATNVWLAGHSLGAAIALQIGKDLARRGCYIESYLFNPPYTSVPIETLHNSHLKTGIRAAKSVLKAGLSVALKGSRNNSTSAQQYDPFNVLRAWIPYLFVNPNDPISCEYIGYFEHREKMEALGMDWIEKIAGKDSVVSLISGAIGRDDEALHLIPSAFVVKNLITTKDDVKLAHGIHQWWENHPNWHCKHYQLKGF